MLLHGTSHKFDAYLYSCQWSHYFLVSELICFSCQQDQKLYFHICVRQQSSSVQYFFRNLGLILLGEVKHLTHQNLHHFRICFVYGGHNIEPLKSLSGSSLGQSLNELGALGSLALKGSHSGC